MGRAILPPQVGRGGDPAPVPPAALQSPGGTAPVPSDGQMRGVSGRPHGQQATVLGGPRRPSAEPPSHRHAPCDVARSGPRRWRQTVWTPGLWTWGLLIPRSLWELDEASSEAGREWRREGRPCQLRAARTRRRPGEALLARGGQVQWSPPPGPAHLRRPSGGPWPPGPREAALVGGAFPFSFTAIYSTWCPWGVGPLLLACWSLSLRGQ